MLREVEEFFREIEEFARLTDSWRVVFASAALGGWMVLAARWGF